jgi:hypothetical protein
MISLRGCEGFLLDLASLNQTFLVGGDKYIIIVLLGKIKGAHILPCVPITSSGIEVKALALRLMDLKRAQGFTDGPGISDQSGRVLFPSSSE